MRRDLIARADRRVYPRAFRLAPQGETSGSGQKAIRGVFGIEARLDGMPCVRDLFLGQRQWPPFRDLDLPAHEVETCHQLCDGMLDLKAGVDFEEVELAVRTEDELNCASVGVVEQPPDGERCLRHALTQRRGEAWRGRLLDDLLVAALNRALTLAEMNQRAVLVAENLELDVAWI